jgi:hypothetical protein
MKNFILTIAWILSTAPLIYSLIIHNWLMLILIMVGECGSVVYQALKAIKD